MFVPREFARRCAVFCGRRVSLCALVVRAKAAGERFQCSEREPSLTHRLSIAQSRTRKRENGVEPNWIREPSPLIHLSPIKAQTAASRSRARRRSAATASSRTGRVAIRARSVLLPGAGREAWLDPRGRTYRAGSRLANIATHAGGSPTWSCPPRLVCGRIGSRLAERPRRCRVAVRPSRRVKSRTADAVRGRRDWRSQPEKESGAMRTVISAERAG